MADWPAILRAAAVLRERGLLDDEARLARALRCGAPLDACRAAAVLGDALRAVLAGALDRGAGRGDGAGGRAYDEIWAAAAALLRARRALAGVSFDRTLGEDAPVGPYPPSWEAWAAALSGQRAALAGSAALSTRPALSALLTEALDVGCRRVLVLGNFKRGKSTLINALLGARLLPARMTPATAVLCTLRYAHALEIAVTFVDGRAPVALSLPELEDYVCLPEPGQGEGGDDGDGPARRFRPEVAAVDIGLPWPLLRGRLEVVDSPGLNESSERGERTWAALAAADILVYVLSATEPLSADELGTIERLWDDGHRTILFVVNYANRVDEEEFPPLAERFAHLLAPYGPPGRPLPIFFVGARPALLARERGDEAAFAASGLPALHDALAALAQARETTPLRRARLRQLCDALRLVDDEAMAAVPRALAAIARHEEDCRLLAAQVASMEKAQAAAERSAALRREGVLARQAERRRACAEARAAVAAEIDRRGVAESLTWLLWDMPAWLSDRISAEARRCDLPLVQSAPGDTTSLISPPPPEAMRGRSTLLAYYHAAARRALTVPDLDTAEMDMSVPARRADAEVQAARRALAAAERSVAAARDEARRTLAEAAALDETILRLQAMLLEGLEG